MKLRIAPAPAPAITARRVVVYARVSTVRQAEADLSIPDQIAQARSWCERQGHELVREYIEPGASGTDESRQVFQQLLADDPTGQMVESILVAFDAYTSKEIGKHTARAMKENARQGFWNGSRPPFGYQVVEAEQRGQKVKKRLEIVPAEAALVRRIFGLYQGAEGVQLGVKAIVTKLNASGERFRGKPFMISNIHRILTGETYMGQHWFNVQDSRTGAIRPREEWISVEVPRIISRETWEAVQAQLVDIKCQPRSRSEIVQRHDARRHPIAKTRLGRQQHERAVQHDRPAVA